MKKSNIKATLSYLVMLQILLPTHAASCRNIMFLPIELVNKSLINHVIDKMAVESEDYCQQNCWMNPDCVSFNIGMSSHGVGNTENSSHIFSNSSSNGNSSVNAGNSSGIIGNLSENVGTSLETVVLVCELNNADRHQFPSDFVGRGGFTYRETQNNCKNDSCSQHGFCQNGFGQEGFRCLCNKGFTGSNCETEILETVKANSVSSVCIGAKDNLYGVFTAPMNGQVKTFKFVYISGGLSWSHGKEYHGKWGDTSTKNFEIHVTDARNFRLTPPSDYPMVSNISLRYNIPGLAFETSTLTFPDLNPKLMVTKGEVFRAWYGEDLVDHDEANNSGATCADVFVVYSFH